MHDSVARSCNGPPGNVRVRGLELRADLLGGFSHDGNGREHALARHPVPIMLLARLGVSVAWQGSGIGASLLKDAMGRTLQAAYIGGIRAFAVHAKDDPARRFYEHFGFVASPTDPLHLFLPVKDLRRVVG